MTNKTLAWITDTGVWAREMDDICRDNINRVYAIIASEWETGQRGLSTNGGGMYGYKPDKDRRLVREAKRDWAELEQWVEQDWHPEHGKLTMFLFGTVNSCIKVRKMLDRRQAPELTRLCIALGMPDDAYTRIAVCDWVRTECMRFDEWKEDLPAVARKIAEAHHAQGEVPSALETA